MNKMNVEKNNAANRKIKKFNIKEQLKEPSTWILIALLIVILVILGFIIAGFLRDKKTNDEALDAVDRFDKVVDKAPLKPEEIDPSKPNNFIVDRTDDTQRNGSRVKMGEYDVVGTLRIPKTKVKYPILTPVSARSLEKGLAMLESTNGVNKPGNTVILGHNYRNNMFFSKNYTLKNGDKIYVKDLYGKEVEYSVYQGRYVSPNYSDYIRRDTKGRTEISLSTCSDNSKERYLILAKRTKEPTKAELQKEALDLRNKEELKKEEARKAIEAGSKINKQNQSAPAAQNNPAAQNTQPQSTGLVQSNPINQNNVRVQNTQAPNSGGVQSNLRNQPQRVYTNTAR